MENTVSNNEWTNCPKVGVHEFGSLVGKVVYSEDEAHNLYSDYAYVIGFGVRCAKSRYWGRTDKLRQKEYWCRCEGFKADYKPGEEPQHKKLDVRTGCKAMIRYNISLDQKEWTVSTHVMEHNHYLAGPEERHLVVGARRIGKAKSDLIKSLLACRLKPSKIYDVIAMQAGGEDNVGFMRKDCYNFVTVDKKKLIDVGDANSLIQYFKKRSLEDPMFYYSYQLDQEGRLTNFFWRDGRCRYDYDIFGDVVIFDTTYRTNKYNLICAPFTGILFRFILCY